MEGHRAVRIHIPHFLPVLHNEELQMVDGPIRGHIIRHQQLMPPWRALQLLPHGNGNLLIDGDRAYLAALALDGDGVLPECPFRRGGIDAKTLVDAETGIPGQVHGKDEVITVNRQSLTQHLVELPIAPGAVILPEPAAFQCNAQLVVGRQRVFVIHLVMEKPDGRQIRFDGTGRFTGVLQIDHITDQMLTIDVGQLLQMVHICQIGTESLHGLIIAPLCMKAALPIVPENTIQLCN